MSALSDLLAANLPEGWSARRVAREAEKIVKAQPDRLERAISEATATAYLGGRHGEPKEWVLKAFHVVLDVPLSDLRIAAGLPPDLGQWEPPDESLWLRPDQRRVLEGLIRVMARDAKELMGNAPPIATDDEPLMREVSGERLDLDDGPGTPPARRRRRRAGRPLPAPGAARRGSIEGTPDGTP